MESFVSLANVWGSGHFPLAILSANNSINKAPFSGEKIENIPSNTFKAFVKLRISGKSGFDHQSLA